MKSKAKNFIRQRQMRGETVRALVECIARGIDTKRKIMAETGFSWGSVATITTELLECRVIAEYENENDRRTSHYRLTRNEYYALGADISGNGITFSLISGDGTLLETIKINSACEVNNDNCCDTVKAAFDEYCQKSSYDSDKILNSVLALTGAVDCENCCWIFSPHHKQIDNCRLESLKETFPGSFRIEHDIFSKARSILFHHGLEDKKSVFLHVENGIGLASYSGEDFFTGNRGFSGEIGHIPYENNSSRVCRCGKKGCLECFLSLDIYEKQGAAAIADPFEFLAVTSVNLFDPEYLVAGGVAIEQMLHREPDAWQSRIRNATWMNAPQSLLFYRMEDCQTSYGAALGCRGDLITAIAAGLI